jgi:hypothetical protein
MTVSGEDGAPPGTVPPELEKDYPDWRFWERDGFAFAWWQRSCPQILLKDTAFAALRRRIPLAEKAWKETGSWRATMDAATRDLT